MGTFAGHVLPGSFFVLWSLWTTVHLFYRYSLHTASTKSVSFRSQSRFGLRILRRRIPFETLCKLIVPAVGIIGEIATTYDGRHFESSGNVQHISMYLGFGLHGLTELLLICHTPLPAVLNLDYLSLALAYIYEALLLAFHLHGRPMMETQMHTLLVYAICLCVVASLLEIPFRDNLIVPVVRAYGTLLQGLWLLVIAFVIHSPIPSWQWKQDDHDQMMLVTAIFIWTGSASYIIILILSVAVKFYATSRPTSRTDFEIMSCSESDTSSSEPLCNDFE